LGNDLEIRRAISPPTPQVAASLSPQALREHRAGIASEVRVVLSAYFQPHEAEDIKAAQLAWWCDDLQDWTREQVVYALRKWNRDNPRLRPTPGDILSILITTRGKREAERAKAASPPQEQARPDVVLTDDQRAERAAVLADVVANMRAKAFGSE
jgi:hypothetical protein